jgi:hypothetical protein
MHAVKNADQSSLSSQSKTLPSEAAAVVILGGSITEVASDDL